MGFLDLFKSKGSEVPSVIFPVILGAPAKGRFVTMSRIPDEVFSTGVLGACCGIEPETGEVHAPIDGKISQLADTLHAVGIEAGGMEILLHVGVDTVDMNGDGFTSMVKVGQTVKKGDLLLKVNLAKIHEAGHPATIIMAVTNSDDFASVEEVGSGVAQCGSDVLRVSK